MINVESSRNYPLVWLFVNAFWALVFGYFALHFDSDPISCRAADDHEISLPENVESSTGEKLQIIDVGARFRLLWLLGFGAYIGITVLGILTFCCKNETLRKVIFLVIALLNYAIFFAWIYAIYIRMSHTGQVCSGDYLEDQSGAYQESRQAAEGYLIEQGIFLKMALIAIFLMLIGALSCALWTIYASGEEQRRQNRQHTNATSGQINNGDEQQFNEQAELTRFDQQKE